MNERALCNALDLLPATLRSYVLINARSRLLQRSLGRTHYGVRMGLPAVESYPFRKARLAASRCRMKSIASTTRITTTITVRICFVLAVTFAPPESSLDCPPNAQGLLRAICSTCAMEFAPRKISIGPQPNDYHALACSNYS